MIKSTPLFIYCRWDAVMTPEELYFENEQLVFGVLKKYFIEKLFDEDYQQIGRIGLWKACLSYNSDISKFSTYACHCIYNEIVMEFRKLSAKRLGGNYILLSLSQPIDKAEDGYERVVEDIVIGDKDVNCVDFKGFWESLSDVERVIIRCLESGMTRPQMTELIGLSHTTIWRHVVQIKKKWNSYI